MNNLEQAIYELDAVERASECPGMLQNIDTRAKLLVTIVFLICVLSLNTLDLPKLIIFLSYPIIAAVLTRTDYHLVAKRSLIVLPFVIFIGIFNPVFSHEELYTIRNFKITTGWVSFFSIVLRGIIATQAVIILIMSSGFYAICHAMRRLGTPTVLANQLLFVYRYIFVLLQEALSMHRARLSRSNGKKNYPLKIWGIFIGQLFLRTINRSHCIHNAMLSRGFTGELPRSEYKSWSLGDTIFLIAFCTAFLLLRFTNLNSLL